MALFGANYIWLLDGGWEPGDVCTPLVLFSLLEAFDSVLAS